jgi:hypothetical protein
MALLGSGARRIWRPLSVPKRTLTNRLSARLFFADFKLRQRALPISAAEQALQDEFWALYDGERALMALGAVIGFFHVCDYKAASCSGRRSTQPATIRADVRKHCRYTDGAWFALPCPSAQRYGAGIVTSSTQHRSMRCPVAPGGAAYLEVGACGSTVPWSQRTPRRPRRKS